MKALPLNRIALVLSFAGIYVSGVLSAGELLSVSVPCGASTGCDLVARHPSSHALGVPNAYVGFFVYAILALLSLARLFGWGSSRATIGAGYLLTGLGALASIALTYVEVAVIGAICKWCMASAILMIALLVVHALLMQLGKEESVEPTSKDGMLAGALVLATVIGLGYSGWAMVQGSTKGARIIDVDPNLVMPADAHVYGDPNAPLAIVEFGDLVCPSCRDDFPGLQKYVGLHAGKVKYVFRHFPMFQLKGHAQAATAAVVSEIAAEKRMFWPFVGGMYSMTEEQVQGVASVMTVARSVGLVDQEAMKRAQDKHDKAFLRVMKDLKDGSELGVIGTPTFFLVAPGLKVRASTSNSLYNDLERPEYRKFLNGG